MGFESSHVLQPLVAGEATWQEKQTNVTELLGVDLATVSRRLPTSNRSLRVDDSKTWSLVQLEPRVQPVLTGRSGVVTSGDLAYQARKHLHILVSGW